MTIEKLSNRRPPVEFSAHFVCGWDGSVACTLDGVAEDDRSKAAAGDALLVAGYRALNSQSAYERVRLSISSTPGSDSDLFLRIASEREAAAKQIESLIGALSSLLHTTESLQAYVPAHVSIMRDETQRNLLKARNAIAKAKGE